MSRLQDYEVLQIMGTGTFGTCFKVKNKLTEKLFVWKAISYGDMCEENKQLLVSEINLLKQFNHPHIVQYFNHIISKETETLYIIMECCDGGDLSHWIKRCKKEKCHFEEEFIWRTLYQLSKAIQGCHSHKQKITVLHRDIKPANVFLDGVGNVKLGDFGLARALTEHEPFAETMVGTPFYMSPEVIKGIKYNRKSDIWSLGCLIYELCSLSPPFKGKHMDALSKKIADGRFARIPEMYSSDLQKIIAFMLAVDHGYRPTVEVILHHPTVLTNLLKTKSCIPLLIPDSKVEEFAPHPDLSSTQKNATEIANSTQVLRRELFYSSPKRKMNSRTSGCSSEPEQPTESKRTNPVESKAASDFMAKKYNNPEEIAQEVFNEAFKLRLQAIKARESCLNQKEREIKEREQSLVRRERQVKEKPTVKPKDRRKSIIPNEVDHRRRGAPVSRQSEVHDASYVSIEPNDTVLPPTTAKMNPDRLFRPKSFEKKVSFHKSPHKLKNYNIENMPPPPPPSLKSVTRATKDVPKRSSSVAGTKVSSTGDPTKRKSFFGIFNLNHLKKSSETPVPKSKGSKLESKPIVNNVNKVEQDSSPDPESLSNKWTPETKRTAFEMLAIMNAADGINDSQDQTVVESMIVNNKIIRHDRKRQSMIVIRR